ncbi:MAG TPA: lysophospholipid acyltransferase family protein [Bacteroidia bacterium]|nr:lysophospholipid acyltransferase family protein [Bacteroidia bacterium]
MLRLFAWFFKISGWKINGKIPSDIKKCVIIAAPHTSNWDFVFSLGALKILGYKVNYMVKKELFFFPFSILLKNSGGISIDRKKNNNVVDEMVAKIESAEHMYLMLSAEGTRKKVDKWKSGFYYVAQKAQLPICTGFLDYKKKEAGFGPVVNVSGNVTQDLEKIKTFYSQITPKIPQNFNIEGIKINPPKV